MKLNHILEMGDRAGCKISWPAAEDGLVGTQCQQSKHLVLNYSI